MGFADIVNRQKGPESVRASRMRCGRSGRHRQRGIVN